ncbi:hypothetical protein HGRIS_007109 [Hohenbuehelia grisea]|uniref:BTB domain-containing protein n=1 Tax=Hohenbuehelia grisea TaxID=104357 RepID=A0ABR3JBL5_9AGAR
MSSERIQSSDGDSDVEMPLLKRRRTSMNDDTSKPPLAAACHGASEVDASCQRSIEYWFPDGDIVFKVEQHCFRIHRQKLQCSLIFSGMFELPQPDRVESMDGCPLVVLFGDMATDWKVVLHWVYDSQGFVKRAETFDALSGALRISTKYEIPELRTWAVRGMHRRWPRLGSLHSMTYAAFANTAEAIMLARECDVPEILPSAFYALSFQRWSCNSEGGRSHLVLPPPDLRRLLEGRELIQDMITQYILEPLRDPEFDYYPCHGCAQPLLDIWRGRLAPPPGTSPWGCWLSKELATMRDHVDSISFQVCQSCVSHHVALASYRLRRLVAMIPRVFRL